MVDVAEGGITDPAGTSCPGLDGDGVFLVSGKQNVEDDERTVLGYGDGNYIEGQVNCW